LPLPKAKLGKRTAVTVSLRQMDMKLSYHIIDIAKPYSFIFPPRGELKE
jgi:hypothetical protein